MENQDEDPSQAHVYEEVHVYEELDPSTFKLTPREQLSMAQATAYEESWQNLESSMSGPREPMLRNERGPKSSGSKKKSPKKSSTQSSPQSSTESSPQSSAQSGSQSSTQSGSQNDSK